MNCKLILIGEILMPRGAETRGHSLRLFQEGPVKDWLDVQSSPGSSIGELIVFVTSYIGKVVDLPSTLPKIRAKQLKNAGNDLINETVSTYSKSANKKYPVKARTIRIPEYDEVKAWFDAQNAPGESVNQLIFLAIGMFGITDFPFALSLSQGRIFSALESSFTKNGNKLEDKKVEQKKSFSSEQVSKNNHNEMQKNIDLSMLSHDPNKDVEN